MQKIIPAHIGPNSKENTRSSSVECGMSTTFTDLWARPSYRATSEQYKSNVTIHALHIELQLTRLTSTFIE